MQDHNGVLVIQRVLLAGTLGMAMARKAAAILEGEPRNTPQTPENGSEDAQNAQNGSEDPQNGSEDPQNGSEDPQNGSEDPRSVQELRSADGAVLRAILDAANECLGHFDDRPAGERCCDTLFHLLDLAAFAAGLGCD